MSRLRHTLALSCTVLVLAGLLGACTTTFDSLIPDRRPDYRESKAANPLEVPPDLTTSTIDDTLMVPELNPTGTARFSEYASERGGSVGGQRVATTGSEAVLQAPPGMTMERDGNRRWLVVQQPADQLWPKLKEFWTGNGLVLKRDDPRIGIMETDWAENRADIPGGFIQSVLRKYLDFAYSAPTRDKFRLRVERVDEGTAIYLSHYGVEEVAIGGVGQQRSDIIRWQPRPPDPELEAEMLNRLMVYLGASEKRAAAQQAKVASATRPTARAQLTTVQGQPALVIDQDYARAWRLVGLALDGSNFLVEDQNRGQGRYLVEYREPQAGSADQGWFSRLAFWRDSPPPQGTRYQVRLSGQGEKTTVVIQNADGQPDNSPAAGRLLQTLQEAIK